MARVDELLEFPCDGLLMAPGLTRMTADRFARRDAPARILTLDTFFRLPGEQEAGTGSPPPWSRQPGWAWTA